VCVGKVGIRPGLYSMELEDIGSQADFLARRARAPRVLGRRGEESIAPALLGAVRGGTQFERKAVIPRGLVP